MQKINFQNLPSTATPLNATNMNAIQTNVENVFNGVVPAGNMVVNSIKTKNMISKSDLIYGIYNVGQGAYVYGTNACCTAKWIEIDNTKDYVLSTENQQTTSSFYVMFYDSNGGYLGNISNTFSNGSLRLGTYSNYSSAKYVNFRFDVVPASLINPMFEEGTTKTTFMSNQNLNIQASYQDSVLKGEKYKFNSFTVYTGTVVVGFTNGVANLDITNLHFTEKPFTVLATICSEYYGIKYDFDNSSSTSLKFELFNGSGGLYNKTGNVRFTILISGTTNN